MLIQLILRLLMLINWLQYLLQNSPHFFRLRQDLLFHTNLEIVYCMLLEVHQLFEILKEEHKFLRSLMRHLLIYHPEFLWVVQVLGEESLHVLETPNVAFFVLHLVVHRVLYGLGLHHVLELALGILGELTQRDFYEVVLVAHDVIFEFVAIGEVFQAFFATTAVACVVDVWGVTG